MRTDMLVLVRISRGSHKDVYLLVVRPFIRSPFVLGASCSLSIFARARAVATSRMLHHLRAPLYTRERASRWLAVCSVGRRCSPVAILRSWLPVTARARVCKASRRGRASFSLRPLFVRYTGGAIEAPVTDGLLSVSTSVECRQLRTQFTLLPAAIAASRLQCKIIETAAGEMPPHNAHTRAYVCVCTMRRCSSVALPRAHWLHARVWRAQFLRFVHTPP